MANKPVISFLPLVFAAKSGRGVISQPCFLWKIFKKEGQLMGFSAFGRKAVFFGLVLLLAGGFAPPARAAAYLTLDSYSGRPAAVTASGGGWVAGETVSLYYFSANGNPAAKAVASSGGNFGPVPLPFPSNAPEGPLEIVGMGSASGQVQSATFFAAPYDAVIDVESSANTPGTVIAVSGKGFAPNEEVNLAFGHLPAAAAKSDARGSFSKIPLTVPDLRPDTYNITASGSFSGAKALGYFYVGGFFPSASPSAYFLLPLQEVAFSGYGFAPGESIDIFLGSGLSPAGIIKADQKGSFSNAGNIVIPPALAGSDQEFVLKSSVTGAVLSMTVTIGMLSPQITPSRFYLNPGEALDFYGKGFLSNEKITVREGQNRSPLSVIEADKNGGFAGTGRAVVPFSSAGQNLTYTFTGEASGSSASTTVSVGAYNPQIQPSEYHLTPGKEYTVWGSGFAPGEKVTVAANGSTIEVATDNYGFFKVAGPFAAPFAQGSSISVEAVGQDSGAGSSLALKVGSLHPSAVPESYYVTPGDQIRLSGYGFAPKERVLLKEGEKALAVIETDEFGNFENQKVSSPFAGGQEVSLTLAGEKSGAVSEVLVGTAVLHPLVTPDRYYAVPGSTLKVMATGFSRGEPIIVSGGSSSFAVSANKDGYTPWTLVTLPFDLLMDQAQITFTGEATGASGFATVSIAPFNPLIYPSTYHTAPGTEVSFSGIGFAPNEDVSVLFDGNLEKTVKTNLDGAFAVEGLLIPVDAKNSAEFAFYGLKSQASSKVEISLAPFNPQVSPSAYYTSPGSDVYVHGWGFAPGETVEVLMDNKAAGSYQVDGKGNFSSHLFNIPYTAGKSVKFAFQSSITKTDSSLEIGLSSYEPQAYPSSYHARPGSGVAIKGIAFVPGETVAIEMNGVKAAEAVADGEGSFLSEEIILPYGISEAVFNLFSSISRHEEKIAVSVAQFSPSIALSAYYALSGSPLVVTGSGYAPGEQVEIIFAGNLLGVVKADSKGALVFKGLVPASGTGISTVSAKGLSSGAAAQTEFTHP